MRQPATPQADALVEPGAGMATAVRQYEGAAALAGSETESSAARWRSCQTAQTAGATAPSNIVILLSMSASSKNHGQASAGDDREYDASQTWCVAYLAVIDGILRQPQTISRRVC